MINVTLNKTIFALTFALAMTACTVEEPTEQYYLECVKGDKVSIKTKPYDVVEYSYDRKVWLMMNYKDKQNARYFQQVGEFCEQKRYIEGVTHETEEDKNAQ